MSIPASIAISKMRIPEVEEPVTRGRVVVDRGQETNEPASALHAFSQGATFGLVVAGQILYEPKICLCYSNTYVTHALLSFQCQCAYHFVSRCYGQRSPHLDRPWLWHQPAYLAACYRLHFLPYNVLPWLDLNCLAYSTHHNLHLSSK